MQGKVAEIVSSRERSSRSSFFVMFWEARMNVLTDSGPFMTRGSFSLPVNIIGRLRNL